MKTNLLIQKDSNSSSGCFPEKNFLLRTLFLFAIGFIHMQANCQVDQRVAMADKYYAAGEYYTAAGLYEQYLNPPKKEITPSDFPLNSRRYGQSAKISKSDILYRQAESYRLSNHLTEAAEKYKECYEKDPVKYADAMYWYAICQRSLSKYDEAEKSLKIFLNGDASAQGRKEAENELQTIQFIKKQLARPDIVMYKVNKVNNSFSREKGAYALNHITGDKFILTSSIADANIASGSNPNHSRLFYALYNNGTLQNLEPVNIQGLDSSLSQGAGCLSADGNYLYFTQWKKENGINISSIWFSKKQENGWGKPVLLSSINRAGHSSKQPFCSADGKTLYFASDMPGGAGGFDIWSANLHADGTTDAAVNAGSLINTKEDEQAPFYHFASNQLVFASNGMQGMGGFDLFTSKMIDTHWNMPSNMGYPVNSSRDDIYFYAPEEKQLLKNAVVGSDRGSECCLEIYSVVKAPKKKMINGIVRDCKNNEPLANATIIMNDIAGKSSQFTTGSDGMFSFSLTGEMGQQTFKVNKENYNEKMVLSATESINETDVFTDVYINVPICIEPIVVEEKKLVIKAENVVTVFFDFDKSILSNRSIEILDSIFTVLAENKSATIQISGYTDGLGSDQYNKKLSDRRAKACADYLKKKGVETIRISFVSFGKCCPVEMEIINGRDNPDGRSKNRRALINISKEE